ncbi:MAG TPA: hypothetical protein VM345_13380 [Acidimicrobiales bacterium]|jgi:hypothetical protein|nr:hypothetical protein [Acidimicrobiales bacterium]
MTDHALLAHSGGFSWDEALFLVLPVIVLLILTRQARKKAEEAEPTDGASETSAEATTDDG